MMADLYTSQVHLKRLLAGQATAAFTPAPEVVVQMLDPEFFLGLGALNEDEHGRLQCPVRGCGEWHAWLGAHIRAKHRAIGGVPAIREALDIPNNRPLMSRAIREVARKQLTAPRRQESMAAALARRRDYKCMRSAAEHLGIASSRYGSSGST